MQVFVACSFQMDPINCSRIVQCAYNEQRGMCYLIAHYGLRQTIAQTGLDVVVNVHPNGHFASYPGVSDGVEVRHDK